MTQIENVLRQLIGLDAATVGSSLIERAVRLRMRQCGLAKKDDYLKLIHTSSKECDALVESVVITETWFFRDRKPFEAMVQLVFKDWLPGHPAGGLRLLSVPCSTGEEPYSLAMALLHAGIPANRFHIDAVDISTRALEFARRAIYGRNSFREHGLDFRARHFEHVAEGHSLNAEIKERVNFQQGNILDDQCLEGDGNYDIIFCRNLMIYLDKTAQKKIIRKLRRLLAPSGSLFLGAAELPLALDNGFVSANHSHSFACHHKASAANQVVQPSQPEKPAIKQNRAPSAVRSAASNLSFPTQSPRPMTDLARARQLAERGHLVEAAEICETYIREHGVSAEAFYLLGLARNAAGADTQAGEFYRKALYLEPSHYETMIQWASLSQKNGDDDRARILQERAKRVKKRS